MAEDDAKVLESSWSSFTTSFNETNELVQSLLQESVGSKNVASINCSVKKLEDVTSLATEAQSNVLRVLQKETDRLREKVREYRVSEQAKTAAKRKLDDATTEVPIKLQSTPSEQDDEKSSQTPSPTSEDPKSGSDTGSISGESATARVVKEIEGFTSAHQKIIDELHANKYFVGEMYKIFRELSDEDKTIVSDRYFDLYDFRLYHRVAVVSD